MRRQHRGQLLAKGEDARLENLESNFPVTEIFKPDAIKIRLTDIDGKLLAPIIRNAIEGNVMAGFEGANLIDARPEGRLKRCLIERMAFVIGGGEDRLPGDDQRRFPAMVRL